MAREKTFARKLASINPDSEDRLNGGDAHGLVQLERLNPPDGPSLNAISLGGGSYSQNFDSLVSSLPTDWFFSETGSNADAAYAANNGSLATGNTYSYGDAAAADRAFGVLRSGSLISTIGASFTNSTGGIINSLLINYVGEQWRLGATGRNDRLDFEISFNATSLTTGIWVAVDGLDFIAPVSTGVAGALNGNANAVSISFNITQLTIASGATFWIRWLDFDAAGSDDGLAIDNFTLATPGALAINDVALNEGNAGSTAFTFTVTRSGGSSGAVAATWTIGFPGSAGGANSGDLAAGQGLTGAVSFANGETSKTIIVNVAGDYLPEDTETFNVTLSAPTGGATISDATGVGTIANDDFPGAISIDDVSHMEGDGGSTSFTFTVTRTDGSLGAVGATWTLTLSGDADAADFTAFPQTGTISFADGETSKTITIIVQGDTLFEPNETFAILLSAPTGGATIADDNGQGTIANDDPMLAPAVDLDGGAPGIDYDGSFTEGSATGIGVSIQVTQGTFPITGATIALTDGLAGDSLSIVGTLPPGIANVSGNDQQIQLVGLNMSAADWAAALGQIAFTSSSDNPDTYGTDAARTITVEVSDGFTISATATATIAIDAVNDSPIVGALDGDSVLWTEGDPYVLLDQDMPATVFDPDDREFGGGFLSVGVQANPKAEDEFFVLDIFPGVGTIGNHVYVDGAHIGTITSSGAGQILTISFTAEATAERVATLLDYIGYRNAAGDDPTAGARSVTYLLNDGSGGASGGVVTVTVAAVNDAPVVTTTPGTTVYVESVNTAPGSVAVNNGLTVADADDMALVGATVWISNNFQAGQDILVFSNTNSATFGNIAASYDFSIGVLTLTSSGGTATVAQWQAALRAVTYSNLSQEPGEATRTIAFTVDDGEATSAAATRLLSVTAQNDSPAGTDANVTILEDATFTFNASHFGFSDIDGDAFAGVRFGAAPAGGTLYFDADGAGGAAPVAIASFPTTTYSAADIAAGKLTFVPTANLNGTGAASVGFTVVDNGGTVGAGQNADTTPNTLSFDIISVNDAPSGADQTITITEDIAYTLKVADFGYGDVDGNAFEAVIFSNSVAGGTLYINGNPMTNVTLVYLHTIQSGGVVFVPAANATGAVGSLTFTVRDDGGFANGGQAADTTPNTLTFSMTAVNDAPVNAVPGAQAIDEDVALLFSSANGNALSVSDVDATTLTVTLVVDHGTLTLASTAGLTFSGGSDGTADASMTFSGTAAAINAALGAGLTYVPNANFNGSDAISVVTTDGGQSGTGPAGTDSDSVAIGITAVNDAPSGAGATITLNEDGTRVLTQADFGFSDPVESNGFAGVVITTLPTNGTLLLNGAALLVAETFVTAAELAAGQLVFQPDANANGAAYATLTFQVRDDGGTGNGGQDTDQSANTLTFAVNAINDSPVVDLNGAGSGTSATLNYSENGAATAIAPGGAIIEVDTTDFGGGTLWVTITNGLNAEDILSILDQGTGAGQVGYANSLITYEGVTIADLLPTLGAPVPVLDIRFRSNVAVSPAAVDAVLRAIAYHNISQDPATAPRNVTFSFNDGDGNPAGGDPPGNATATINVASLNDVPSGTSATIAIGEDGSRVLAQADFGFADPAEGDAFAGVLLTSLPASGTLLLDGVAVTVAGTFVSAAQLAAGQLVFAPGLNGNGAGYASFNFAVRDDGGTASGGLDTDQSPNTLTFNVTAINDAPAGADATIVMNEDVGRVLTAADFGFSDTADGNAFAGVVLTSLPTAGFLIYDPDGSGFLPGVFANVGRFITAAELAMGALTYYPPSHANGAAVASFTFQVRDDGGTADGGQNTDQSPNTIAFDVNPVNDAPSGADKSITGSEDDPYIFTAVDFGFTDPVEGSAFFAVGITTLPAAGDILLNGVAVMAGDFIAVSAIEAGMLTFQPDPNAFGAPYASFTFQVRDSGGTANGGVDTDQTPNTIAITITPDNLAPVLDLDSGAPGADAALSYTENNPATPIAPAATLTDDSADFAGGTIIARFAANGAAEDRLSIRSGNGIAVSPSDDTLFYGGVLIGSWGGGVNGADLVVQLNANATAAAVEAVLRAIAYANLSDAPSVLARTIAVEVTDGDGGAASAQVTVNPTAVDDAAVARNDAFAIDEAAVLSSNVFLDHGAGADGDVDGPNLAVSAVNGSSFSVGRQIQLASGALLTLNADGSFTYAANHAFDATPTGSSGASNTPAVDHFTYTLAGGGTATVTLAIAGLDSDDTLFGTAGADVLAGGSGNDSYRVENEADLVVENAGGGRDGVYVAMNLGGYALAAGSEVEILSAIDPASAAAMNLTGNEFANMLIGTAGSNTLIGGGGADALFGGAGNDFYRVEEAGDIVVEGAGGGFDSVYAVTSYTLAAGSEVELLSAIDPASTAAMNLTGNEYANRIHGNAAANTLIGGAGDDTLFGGAGNDFYRVETAGDIVVEYAGGGFDSVYAVDSCALAAGSEVELLSAIDPASTAAMNLTGNEFANLIYGNAGVNVLIGGGGADVLFGGAGGDFYRVEEAGDSVVEAIGGGSDAVYATSSYALTAGSEIELLSAIDPSSTAAMDLTGNAFANTIIGTAGANTLIGGGGNDVLAGGLGNDVYRVEDAGDVVLEAAGGGADAVYATISYTLQAGNEVEVLAAIDPASTAALNLTGNEAGNTLFGNAGANMLDGKTGGDALVGGGGADIFAFTTALGGGNVDTIFDFAAGTDRIGLDDAIFTAVGGSLNPDAFVIGAAAAGTEDRIVYNQATGQLFYDSDGSGGGAAILFATVQGAPVLSAGDFTMI